MASNLRARITRLEERIEPQPGCAICGGSDPILFPLCFSRGEAIPDVCPECGCPPPRPSIEVLRRFIRAADAADAAGMSPEPLPAGTPGDQPL